MMRITVPLLLLALSACATTANNNAPTPAAARTESAPARQLHTDLVREMIAQGRYYAALAHIEELQKSGGPREELLLLHAQVLAKLDRKGQAEQEYQQLLGSAFDGEARHGLGLLYASKNFSQSLQYLREAARLRPTDPTIRNDYGYALLMGGQYPEARLQLATAYELDSGMDKYRNNYVLALLLFKDEAEIKRVRQRSDMTDKLLQNLRAQAQGWPAVVQRSTATAAPVSSAAPAPAAAKPPADRSNSVKKKLGVPGIN
ncbi:MAG: tetratricopeptide repeat protein [Nevskiales bacterium]